MQTVVWDIARDSENIRSGAIDLRAASAAQRFLPLFADAATAAKYLRRPKVRWRLNAVDKLAHFAGKPIGGRILEIGAGTAWCSAVLSTRPSVERVYALEYDAYCINTLMPAVVKGLRANEDKFVGVLGSFNKIEFEPEAFDFIIALGALHHSENLSATLAECYRVLKPGGFMVACEPVYSNRLTQSEVRGLEDRLISTDRAVLLYGDAGRRVRAKDNSDHFYRLCEFEAHGFSVGFDVYPYVFDATSQTGGVAGLAHRALRDAVVRDGMFRSRETYAGDTPIVRYPYFAVHDVKRRRVSYDRLLVIYAKE